MQVVMSDEAVMFNNIDMKDAQSIKKYLKDNKIKVREMKEGAGEDEELSDVDGEGTAVRKDRRGTVQTGEEYDEEEDDEDFDEKDVEAIKKSQENKEKTGTEDASMAEDGESDMSGDVDDEVDQEEL